MTDSSEKDSNKDTTQELKSPAQRTIPRPKYQQPPKFPPRQPNNKSTANNNSQYSDNNDVKMDIQFSQFDKQPKISAIRRSTPQPGQYHLDLNSIQHSSSGELANSDRENNPTGPAGSGVQLDIDFQKFDNQGPSIRLPTPRPGQTVGPGGVTDEDYCHYNPPSNEIGINDSPEEDYGDVRIEIPLCVEEDELEDDLNNIQIDANQINEEIIGDVKLAMDFDQFDGESCANRMATPRPDKPDNIEEQSIGEEEEDESNEHLENIRIEIAHAFDEPATPTNSAFSEFDITKRKDRVSTPRPHAHTEVFNEENAEIKLLTPIQNSDDDDENDTENIRIDLNEENKNEIRPNPISQFDITKRQDRVSTPRPHIRNAQIDLNSIEFAEEEEEGQTTPKATSQTKTETHPPMPKHPKVPIMPKILQTKKFSAPIPKPSPPTTSSTPFAGDDSNLDVNNRQDRMSTPRPVKNGKKFMKSNPLNLPAQDVDNEVQMNIDFAQFDGPGCAQRMATPRPSRNSSNYDMFKPTEEEEEEAEDPTEISPIRNFKFPINDENEEEETPLVIQPVPRQPAAHLSTPRPGRSCVREAFKDAGLAEYENADEYANEQPLDDEEDEEVQLNIDYSQFETAPGDEISALRRATPRPSKQRLVVEENAPQSSSSDDNENEPKELTPNRPSKSYNIPQIPIIDQQHSPNEIKEESPKSTPPKYNLPLLNFGPFSNITKDNQSDGV